MQITFAATLFGAAAIGGVLLAPLDASAAAMPAPGISAFPMLVVPAQADQNGEEDEEDLRRRRDRDGDPDDQDARKRRNGNDEEDDNGRDRPGADEEEDDGDGDGYRTRRRPPSDDYGRPIRRASCEWERRRVQEGYGWSWKLVRVCTPHRRQPRPY